MEKVKHTLEDFIQSLVIEYISEWNNKKLSNGRIYKCESAFDINNGLCDNFAESLISLLGGEKSGQFILSNDMFLCDFFEEAVWNSFSQTKGCP